MTTDHSNDCRHYCSGCGRYFGASLPMLVCVHCGSHLVNRNHALMLWRAGELAKRTGCTVASELPPVSAGPSRA